MGPRWLDAAAAPSLAGLDALADACGAPTYAPAFVAALAAGLEPGAEGPCPYGWVVLGDAARPRAAAPAFVTTEVPLDRLAPASRLRLLAGAARRLPRALRRSLVLGTHLTDEGSALALGPRDLDDLVAAGERVARSAGALTVFWKDVPAGSALEARLAARGYAPFCTLPTARVDLRPFRTLDEYLGWVGGEASYGDLARKMRDAGYDTPGLREHAARLRARGSRALLADRRAALAHARARLERLGFRGAPLSFETRRRLDPAEARAAHALYRHRLEAAHFRWEALTPAFFERLGEVEGATFSLARLGDALVGFSASIVRRGLFVALRSGADPALTKPLSLTLLLMLRDLELALELGCHALSLGPTSYPTKARLGARFGPTSAMLRLLGPLAPLSPLLARAVDREHRALGIHRLHQSTHLEAWAPKAPPRRHPRPHPTSPTP
ncbi:MAG TPA: GNAT family N-acetyltransferase [Polyangiaceae bacterium]|nr:GNAT family N-acetyltransferase [Polyangiaceae bacterium]